MLREVEAHDISDNVKVTSDNRKLSAPPVLPGHKLSPSTSNALIAQGSGTTPANKGFQCSVVLASCDRMTNTNTRKKILKRDRRCFVCLRKGHGNDQCQQNKSCRLFQGNHHQSLRERPFEPVEATVMIYSPTSIKARVHLNLIEILGSLKRD